VTVLSIEPLVEQINKASGLWHRYFGGGNELFCIPLKKKFTNSLHDVKQYLFQGYANHIPSHDIKQALRCPTDYHKDHGVDSILIRPER
jgi:hypothetical protein